MADITVSDEGTIIRIKPETAEAHAWIDANVDAPDWAWMGGYIVGDHRPMRVLVEGAIADGLVVREG